MNSTKPITKGQGRRALKAFAALVDTVATLEKDPVKFKLDVVERCNALCDVSDEEFDAGLGAIYRDFRLARRPATLVIAESKFAGESS
jgi:hypothetical protein